MTDYTPPTIDEIAKLCWDNYYESELTGLDAIDKYLQGGRDEHDNTFDNLVELLYDDIRDLLHNGNDEDLFGSLDDTEALSTFLHDSWMRDPNPLELVCEQLAHKALATLNTTDSTKED